MDISIGDKFLRKKAEYKITRKFTRNNYVYFCIQNTSNFEHEIITDKTVRRYFRSGKKINRETTDWKDVNL